LGSRDAFWRQRPLTTLSLGHAGKQASGFGRDECAWRGRQVIQKLAAIGPVLAAVNHRRIGDVTRFQNAEPGVHRAAFHRPLAWLERRLESSRLRRMMVRPRGIMHLIGAGWCPSRRPRLPGRAARR
jgi:hypothetical protein